MKMLTSHDEQEAFASLFLHNGHSHVDVHVYNNAMVESADRHTQIIDTHLMS